ncbi:MAG: disulfide bond formation protein DsbA [Chromatiales bacterium]|jgi:2-hydroxychromene-2-carboxylate isomerase|nr:disulfide bond formation protein DsbA [Chromatiales bacterium]MDP6150567.1 DsbA family protein [Gammaproteobacteria bacterium]MDP7092943.1 DsbA family protein [Gammaproteobacteria bacterium]MDP7270197.1 DsbA family protein [Gammaproteobacteria bacterium]HJP04272.1 DsbA family protein [Gammaproteobacteria bacterium]
MSLQVDLFWSFRSPYSYLVMPRIKQLVEEFEVDVHARPVYPLAVRDPSILKKMHPLFLNYFLLDSKRLAEFYGIAIAAPDPDPVDITAAMSDEPGDQSRVTSLMRLAAAAAERDLCLPFIDEVSRMIFGRVKNWDEDSQMHAAMARAGLDPDELHEMVTAKPEKLDEWIESNHRDQEAAGHWGVPLMVFEGEAFFGQDRFDLLVWRLHQHGLAKR